MVDRLEGGLAVAVCATSEHAYLQLLPAAARHAGLRILKTRMLWRRNVNKNTNVDKSSLHSCLNRDMRRICFLLFVRVCVCQTEYFPFSHLPVLQARGLQ